MAVIPDQPAKNPFWFAECHVLTMPIGKMATNLRELLEMLREVDEAVVYYHLWQYRLAIARPVVEYPNDFAVWAATALQDSKLAEKLSSIDPFNYHNMTQVREALVDLLEDYLWQLPYVPWVRPGFEFHFCEASTVVVRTWISARTLAEFHAALSKVGLDSIHWHFVDARWRLRSREKDDFSTWIRNSYDLPELVSAIQGIDIAFYALEEVRTAIIALLDPYVGNSNGQTE
jgi:hypothetical protein